MKLPRRKELDTRRRAGQSTIEFLLVIGIVFGFGVFYYQFAAFLLYGNYAQYATFMASRALTAGGINADDQTKRADEVLVRMLRQYPTAPGSDRFPALARSEGGNSFSATADVGDGPEKAQDPNNKDFSWQEGVRYKFRGRLILGFLGASQGTNALELTSESWLGRGPTFDECVDFMESKGSIDNGC